MGSIADSSGQSSSPRDDIVLVDDYYWLGRARNLVENGAALRFEASRQLMGALSWLWTVYTGAALVTAAVLPHKLNLTRALVFAIPVVLLVAAYGSAIQAHMPVHFDFDPLDPEDIRRAHITGIRSIRRRLTLALSLSALAAASIAAAVIVAALAGGPAK